MSLEVKLLEAKYYCFMNTKVLHVIHMSLFTLLLALYPYIVFAKIIMKRNVNKSHMEKKSSYAMYANSEFHLQETSKMKWPTCVQVQEKKL